MSELNIFSVLARSRQSVGKAKRVSQRRDRSGLGRLGSGYATRSKLPSLFQFASAIAWFVVSFRFLT